MRSLIETINEACNKGLGNGGECVCPKCGYEMDHDTGVPCDEVKCPKCGAMMEREGKKVIESFDSELSDGTVKGLKAMGLRDGDVFASRRGIGVETVYLNPSYTGFFNLRQIKEAGRHGLKTIGRQTTNESITLLFYI